MAGGVGKVDPSLVVAPPVSAPAEAPEAAASQQLPDLGDAYERSSADRSRAVEAAKDRFAVRLTSAVTPERLSEAMAAADLARSSSSTSFRPHVIFELNDDERGRVLQAVRQLLVEVPVAALTPDKPTRLGKTTTLLLEPAPIVPVNAPHLPASPEADALPSFRLSKSGAHFLLNRGGGTVEAYARARLSGSLTHLEPTFTTGVNLRHGAATMSAMLEQKGKHGRARIDAATPVPLTPAHFRITLDFDNQGNQVTTAALTAPLRKGGEAALYTNHQADGSSQSGLRLVLNLGQVAAGAKHDLTAVFSHDRPASASPAEPINSFRLNYRLQF